MFTASMQRSALAVLLGLCGLTAGAQTASAQACTAANAIPFASLTGAQRAAIRAGSSIGVPDPVTQTISATLFIPAGVCTQASFSAYKLPGDGFTLDPYNLQVLSDNKTAYYGPGTYPISIKLPTTGTCETNECIKIELVRVVNGCEEDKSWSYRSTTYGGGRGDDDCDDDDECEDRSRRSTTYGGYGGGYGGGHDDCDDDKSYRSSAYTWGGGHDDDCDDRSRRSTTYGGGRGDDDCDDDDECEDRSRRSTTYGGYGGGYGGGHDDCDDDRSRRTITYVFRVTNTCAKALSNIAFRLPSGVKAISPQYLYQGTRDWFLVENTTNNPFYSIKFNTIGEGIKNGQSETFVFKIPAATPLPTPTQVQVKAGTTVTNTTVSVNPSVLTTTNPTTPPKSCTIAPWQADLYFGPLQNPLPATGHVSNTLIWLKWQVRANDGGLQPPTGRPGPSLSTLDLPTLADAAPGLGRNYPNPFAGRTTIPVTLERDGDVRLDVFDGLGRHMATLLDGRLAAGTHAVPFDGSALTPGVYLYRLTTTAEGVHTGHMTVTR